MHPGYISRQASVENVLVEGWVAIVLAVVSTILSVVIVCGAVVLSGFGTEIVVLSVGGNLLTLEMVVLTMLPLEAITYRAKPNITCINFIFFI